MALDIWLQGTYDFEKLWKFVGDCDYFERRSDLDKGRFTFHLRNVKDVVYQVYSKGKIRIVTDDFSDPYTLIQIIVDAVWLASGNNLGFKILRCAPLLSSTYRIARPLILEKLSPSKARRNEEA
ncbi:MAG: hypothetical protein QMD10_10180, partial [Desulfitobacteriaceae bacterium]|nr:hypothetical protein [Desulfitobacteriaceae bacterium]